MGNFFRLSIFFEKESYPANNTQKTSLYYRVIKLSMYTKKILDTQKKK